MNKQRVTLFLDPLIVKRARARGAMDGDELSRVTEKALDQYAPKIETKEGNLNLNFRSGPTISQMRSGGVYIGGVPTQDEFQNAKKNTFENVGAAVYKPDSR